ncbi:MAG: hypothetical protein ACTSYS_08040 [Promethearchaeota archaeon]
MLRNVSKIIKLCSRIAFLSKDLKHRGKILLYLGAPSGIFKVLVFFWLNKENLKLVK